MDLSAYKVPPEKLRWQCDPGFFTFECTADVTPLEEFVGQDRAIQAINFGLGVERSGYNIFVTGLTGTGKTSAVKSHIQKIVKEREAQGKPYKIDDWCHVHNLTDPDRPRALRLPQGQGKKLRSHMEDLLKKLKASLTRAFTSEEYSDQRKRAIDDGQNRNRQLFQEMEKAASKEGLAIQSSPYGVVVIPLIEGRPFSQTEYLALKEEERSTIEAKRAEFMEQIEETIQKAHALEKETADKVKTLDRRTGEHAISRPFNEITKEYKNFPDVLVYLEETKTYTMDNLDLFQEREGQEALPKVPRDKAPFLPFEVNVFIDNSDTKGPPIIIEPNPTHGNLFGKIERRAAMGVYYTDHMMLKPGSIDLANSGYLVLNARDVLLNPGVWESLKRVIKTKEHRLEDPFEQFGLIAPHGLRPQPIPNEVKIIMIGDYSIYQLLSLYDEDFWEIFKVKADFDFQIGRTPEHMDAYCSFISATCRDEKLLAFDRTGVAEVLEYGARLVADQEKLSTRFGQIKDLLIEADFWAQKANSDLVYGKHVQKALDQKIYRSNRVSERINELIAEGTLMVDVEGAAVGQVNGLAVYDLGDISFGKPSRITAKTFMGRRGVINIERESQLSGKIHDKGVLILSGFLGWKYAQDKPLSLSTSLCFEQSYEGVEGDSASSTELYAILSSLSGLPIKQNIAVTGSVNQMGEIQPIGGVNQKTEGFFDVCKAKGLTGEQGVIIPHQNVRNLMLREDVVEAIKQKQFHVYAVKTVDQGIEILTGVSAGERDEKGYYPEGGVNYLVNERLKALAEGLKGFSESQNA